MSIAGVGSGWRVLDLGHRVEVLSGAARRELSLRGATGAATILGVRPSARLTVPDAGSRPPDHVFRVRVRVAGEQPYLTRVRQRVGAAELEWMRPGEVVRCRIDPGRRDRVVLCPVPADEAVRTSISKILTNGRHGEATVLAAAPVSTVYSGRDDPILRLDLELRAWDEPAPWRVRLVQPVPLVAIGLVDLGRRLRVAFFAVDHGESVAVDWAASLRGR